MLEVSKTPMSHGSLIVSTIAAHFALAAPVLASSWPTEERSIRIAGHELTFGSAVIGSASEHAPLVSFYSEMLSKQRRLSGEFERILFDNLQELYIR